MRICLMVEGQEDVTWEDWLALAGACEDGGLEGLFRSDHYTSVFGVAGRGSLDAWATLTALATVTRRIRLGTMVSPATFRHPSELAKVAATADHVSGGRIELGLGAGWQEQEHRSYGFPFHDVPTRIRLFAEQLEIVHRQWTEDVFSFSGEHYTLEDCRALPKPVQTPHPPLIVGGGVRPGTVGPAVRFADEYNTTYVTTEEARRRRSVLDEACRAAGRDPATLPLSLMTGCIVAPDRATLDERIAAVQQVTRDDSDPATWDGWLIGTVDEVGERMRELAGAGVERFFLQHLDHRDLESVALIGRELVPG
jgi:F420-dependent oxidoreductase-like protein